MIKKYLQITELPSAYIKLSKYIPEKLNPSFLPKVLSQNRTKLQVMKINLSTPNFQNYIVFIARQKCKIQEKHPYCPSEISRFVSQYLNSHTSSEIP